MTTKKKKIRVDTLLVERGLVDNVEQAKRSIMAGIVYSNETRLDTPGEKLFIDAPLSVKGKSLKYVSRGGLKLEKALQCFPITVQQKLVLDIGASTGGFTDCALQNGAAHCYALDVGYNQLAWKLRQDERVTVLERTNFRHATAALFTKGQPQFATIDVSFISLALILPTLSEILAPSSDVVALVKPQFEAPKEEIGEKGVVRQKDVQLRVLLTIANIAVANQFSVKGIAYSPVTGGEGNIEFLFHLQADCKPMNRFEETDFQRLIDDAHEELY